VQSAQAERFKLLRWGCRLANAQLHRRPESASERHTHEQKAGAPKGLATNSPKRTSDYNSACGAIAHTPAHVSEHVLRHQPEAEKCGDAPKPWRAVAERAVQ
jgi:hypothetical protein